MLTALPDNAALVILVLVDVKSVLASQLVLLLVRTFRGRVPLSSGTPDLVLGVLDLVGWSAVRAACRAHVVNGVVQ